MKSKTIDGVPRELLEGLLTLAAMSASAPYRELRALLDAPVSASNAFERMSKNSMVIQRSSDGEYVCELKECDDYLLAQMLASTRAHASEPWGWVQTRGDSINEFTQEWDVVESWVHKGFEYKDMFDHPSAAQPQGDPVAYDQAKENKLFEDWARTQSDVSLRLCDIGLYYKRDTGLAHDAWQHRAKLAEQPAPVAEGTTSDKYRAELYDEVWQKARALGFANVTEALLALERKGELVGKAVINSLGDKAVSFEDSVWSSLPVGQSLYARPPTPEAGEPYAYEYEFATVLYVGGPGKFKKVITQEAPDRHEIDAGCIINVKPLYDLEPRKYDDTLLPFLAMMRNELRANSHKGDREGWLKMSVREAVDEVTHHFGKLASAAEARDMPQVSEYSADVANCAMMLADVCGVVGRA